MKLKGRVQTKEVIKVRRRKLKGRVQTKEVEVEGLDTSIAIEKSMLRRRK